MIISKSISKLSNKYFQIFCILFTTLSYSTSALADNKKIDNYTPRYIKIDNKNQKFLNLDFIDKDWIKDQKSYHACPGYYQPFDLPDVTLPEISADSSELSKDGISVLNGNVIYVDNLQQISAEKALIERDSTQQKFTKLRAEGNIEYLTPKLRIISDTAVADLLNNSAEINNPIHFRYYPRNGRGTASKAVLVKDKSYSLYNSIFTTCPPNTSDWEIHSSEINIDPNNEVGTAKNTTLYFYNVPILYTPYLRFPTSNKRETGLLSPIYNSSDRYGQALAFPMYFNLAPNYDLTIAPRYMSKRDSQLLIETRHLNNKGLNVTNIEYLPEDKAFTHFKHEKLTSPPPDLAPNNPRLTNLRHAGSDRYAIKVLDSRQWNPYLSTDVNYHYLSDNQYFLDLPRSAVLRQQPEDHILQQAKINYNYENWHAETIAKGYQTLHTLEGPDLTEPYRIVPGVILKNNNLILSKGIVASFESRAERFASPSNPKPNQLTEGQRYFMKPAVSMPMTQSYGYITPKLAANIRHYDLNRLDPISQNFHYNKKQNYFTPILSIDSGLYFDKNINFNNQNFIHTIEPRLFYLYIPYKSQNSIPNFDVKNTSVNYGQLFRDNTFSGYDRQSSANQLTAGFVSRLLNAENGQEYMQLQVGQAYYFTGNRVTICNEDVKSDCVNNENPGYNSALSPFISQVNYNFSPSLYGQATWHWDYNLNTTRKINLGVHYIQQNIYEKLPQTILNLEYNFLKSQNVQRDINGNRIYKISNKRNDLSEVETSLKLPITNNLVMIGFYSYDVRNLASLDRYLGFELQKCCWAVRVGYRSQLRLRTNSLAPKKYDNIFTIQFSLKGLGELNQSFENILETNIPGYANQLNQIY